MKKQVIIVAGGKGLRMGSDLPKQFMLIAGRPVLIHTLEAFYNYDQTIRIILVLSEDQQVYWSQVCKIYNVEIPHEVVVGGETRFHSVKNGLKFVPRDVLVAVHDGVRALVPEEIIANAFDTAETSGGAFPVVPVTDSLRKYTDPAAESVAVNRADYCTVQTPQVFLSDILSDAYNQKYDEKFTDDVSVVETFGNCFPKMIPGSKENIKITTPVDLIIADSILKCRI